MGNKNKKFSDGIDGLSNYISYSSEKLKQYSNIIKRLSAENSILELEKAAMLKKGFIGPGGDATEGTLRLYWSAPEEGAYIKELPVFCHECGNGVYHPKQNSKCCEWKCDKCGHVHGMSNSLEELCVYISYDLDNNVMLEKAAADTIKEIADGKTTEERALSCTVFRHQWEKPWFDDVTKGMWDRKGNTINSLEQRASTAMGKMSEKELRDFFVGDSKDVHISK